MSLRHQPGHMGEKLELKGEEGLNASLGEAAAAAGCPDYGSFDDLDVGKGGNRHIDFVGQDGHLDQQGSRLGVVRDELGAYRLGRCCSLHNSLAGWHCQPDYADRRVGKERGTFDDLVGER